METRRIVFFPMAAAIWGLSGAMGIAIGGPGLPGASHEFRAPSAEKVELGPLLMFDKILSGNKNISCGTCHHSLAAQVMVCLCRSVRAVKASG